MPHQGPQISVPGTHNSSMFQLVLRSMKVIRSLNTLESSGWTYSLPGCRSEGFWNISKSREHSHKKTYFYSLPSERIFYLYIYICLFMRFIFGQQATTYLTSETALQLQPTATFKKSVAVVGSPSLQAAKLWTALRHAWKAAHVYSVDQQL